MATNTTKTTTGLFIPGKNATSFTQRTYSRDMLSIQNWANNLFQTWVTLALEAGWSNIVLPSTLKTQCRKVADLTILRGSVRHSSASNPIAVLSPIFRPHREVTLMVMAGSTGAGHPKIRRLAITKTGKLIMTTTSTSFTVVLTQCFFSTKK